jgi:hypothetical protein
VATTLSVLCAIPYNAKIVFVARRAKFT